MRRRTFLLLVILVGMILGSCSRNHYDNSHVIRALVDSPTGYILACGEKGVIALTQDTQKWHYDMIDESLSFFDAVFFKDQFILLGEDLSSEKKVLCFYHPETKQWTLTQYDGTVAHIKVANNQLFLLSNDSIKVSDNGSEWVEVDFPIVAKELSGGDYVKNYPYCIVYDGKNYIVTGGGNFVTTSPDLAEWDIKVENGEGSGSSLGIATNGKRNVIVGDHLYLAYADAKSNTWSVLDHSSIEDIETISDYYTLCLYDVATDGKKFVAVGAHNLILHSENGAEWKISKIDIGPGLRDIRKVIWNGNRFICLRDNELFSSLDGESWSKIE